MLHTWNIRVVYRKLSNHSQRCRTEVLVETCGIDYAESGIKMRLVNEKSSPDTTRKA